MRPARRDATRRAPQRRRGAEAAFVLACALALACSACGADREEPAAPGGGGAAPETRSPTAGAPPRAPAPGPAAPARGGPEEEPPAYPCTGGRVGEGAALFDEHCARCHGPEGDGEGPSAAGLNPKPMHLDDGAYMNRLGNDYLLRIVAEGGAAVGKSSMMPGLEGTLSEEEIRDVVAFVRSLAEPGYRCPEEGPPPREAPASRTRGSRNMERPAG